MNAPLMYMLYQDQKQSFHTKRLLHFSMAAKFTIFKNISKE